MWWVPLPSGYRIGACIGELPTVDSQERARGELNRAPPSESPTSPHREGTASPSTRPTFSPNQSQNPVLNGVPWTEADAVYGLAGTNKSTPEGPTREDHRHPHSRQVHMRILCNLRRSIRRLVSTDFRLRESVTGVQHRGDDLAIYLYNDLDEARLGKLPMPRNATC